MLGTSGTVTTLGAMHLNLPYYSRSLVDGLELNFEDISATSRQLTELDYEGEPPCRVLAENAPNWLFLAVLFLTPFAGLGRSASSGSPTGGCGRVCFWSS